jgi:hypothetical protein
MHLCTYDNQVGSVLSVFVLKIADFPTTPLDVFLTACEISVTQCSTAFVDVFAPTTGSQSRLWDDARSVLRHEWLATAIALRWSGQGG